MTVTGPAAAPAGAMVLSQGAGALPRGAAAVAEAQQDLEAIRVRLEGLVAALAGRWVGAGGSAFLAFHQAWSERQRTITQALAEFEATLLAVDRDLAATDAAQATVFGRSGS